MRSLPRTFSLAGRGVKNYILKRPFCISFEVTYSCNADCKHCHLGGPQQEERASPQRYAEICREIKPVVAQVSGGEPLLRKDLELIIKGLKVPDKAPYIVLTTNGALLTKERYQRLREAGVDEFSLSLDFPDERHDDFRGIPGLFGRINNLIKDLQQVKDKGIILSGVVQSENFRDLLQMARLARDWGVKINFSTYTWLRTDNKNYLISPQDLPELREVLKKVMDFKRNYGAVYTSDYILKKMVEFFQNHGLNGCQAGKRFLVVNPAGTFSPCGLIIRKYRSRREILEDFLKNNSCGECYTSLRANAEKPASYLLKDGLRSL